VEVLEEAGDDDMEDGEAAGEEHRWGSTAEDAKPDLDITCQRVEQPKALDEAARGWEAGRAGRRGASKQQSGGRSQIWFGKTRSELPI
jgi:hypothetical protein